MHLLKESDGVSSDSHPVAAVTSIALAETGLDFGYTQCFSCECGYNIKNKLLCFKSLCGTTVTLSDISLPAILFLFCGEKAEILRDMIAFSNSQNSPQKKEVNPYL